MESDLKHDLFEALEGLDPLELLAEDPALSLLVKNIECDPDFLLGAQISQYGCEVTKHRDVAQGKHEQNIIEKTKVKDGSNNCSVCSICARPSKGHRYYGTVSCISCKAFFSRSMKGETYTTYLCKNPIVESGCFINSKSWISCQLCRFKQCLAAGMVMPGKDKKKDDDICAFGLNRRDQGNKVVSGDSTEDMMTNVRGLLQPTTLITLEEKLKLEKFSLSSLGIRIKAVLDICRVDIDLLPKILELLFYGEMYPLPLKKTMEYHVTLSRKEEYVRSDGPLGDNIGPQDRLKLVSNNISLVNEYFMASKLGRRLDYDCDVKACLHALSKQEDEDFWIKISSSYAQVAKTNDLYKLPVLGYLW